MYNITFYLSILLFIIAVSLQWRNFSKILNEENMMNLMKTINNYVIESKLYKKAGIFDCGHKTE